MLIAVATLTMATANAEPSNWNWSPESAIQIVNNTQVTLVFRTWPDNQLFTVESGKTGSGASSNENELDVAWQYGDKNADVVWRPVFDGYENDQVTMTDHTAWISSKITQGQAWDIINVGSNDKLVFTSTSNSDGSMQLTATRTRGVDVVRVNGPTGGLADVFCLDTNVEFGLVNVGDVGRCPIGETRVVMADDYEIMEQYDIDSYWNAAFLSEYIQYSCQYGKNDIPGITCSSNPTSMGSLSGDYVDGFATVNYSTSNSSIGLSI